MDSISSQTARFQEVRSSTRADTCVKSVPLVLKAWLVLRVAGWLCILPMLLKIYSLPGLLERLSRKGRGNREYTGKTVNLALPHRKRNIEMERVVRIVVRVCRLRLFRLAIFPRPCLRQSLALYRMLNSMNYPVEFHLGVSKRTGEVLAHSWVTFEGRPISDNGGNDIFKIVYSYPATTNSHGGNYERKGKSAAAG
jgi:hypothetical protein